MTTKLTSANGNIRNDDVRRHGEFGIALIKIRNLDLLSESILLGFHLRHLRPRIHRWPATEGTPTRALSTRIQNPQKRRPHRPQNRDEHPMAPLPGPNHRSRHHALYGGDTRSAEQHAPQSPRATEGYGRDDGGTRKDIARPVDGDETVGEGAVRWRGRTWKAKDGEGTVGPEESVDSEGDGDDGCTSGKGRKEGGLGWLDGRRHGLGPFGVDVRKLEKGEVVEMAW